MKARPSEEKCREFVALQPTTTQLNCGASEAINKAFEKEKFMEVRVEDKNSRFLVATLTMCQEVKLVVKI